MAHGDIIKTSIPKCTYNINSILVYHNGFQKLSPTKAFIIVHATIATIILSLVLLQAIALLQEPTLHLFIHSKQGKVILLMRRVAATTTRCCIHRGTVAANTCTCIDTTKLSISNPTQCFFRSLHTNT
jgi:hypothetical protein